MIKKGNLFYGELSKKYAKVVVVPIFSFKSV